jgi:hypothetical protein
MIKRTLIKTSTKLEELPALVDYALYIGQIESLIIEPLEACYSNGRRVHSADKIAFAKGYIAAKNLANLVCSVNY